jgi:hypothetical protein
MGSVAKSSRSSAYSTRSRLSRAPRARRRYVVCLSNEGHPASLEVRKIYVVLADPGAEKNGLLRVVDESSEDYLYPRSRFAALELPAAVERALAST